jgi:two-component system, response regulator / RNA-binding antiterminator
MTGARGTPSFDGWHALVLHRPHATVDAIERQLATLGIVATSAWPDFPEGETNGTNQVLLFDADMGHESQFPWLPGGCPVPAIALVGSEAPGRIAWAIKQGADAHVLKPVGSGGIYSALLIATEAFARRTALNAEVEALRKRLDQREVLAAATATLMQRENLSAPAAYRELRKRAMAERRTLEDMALIVLGGASERHGGA